DHPLPRQSLLAQVAADAPPHLGQPGNQLLHPLVLGPVADLTPDRVVQVLPSTGVVGTDGLDVAIGMGADPDVLPGRWDHQGVDPLFGLLVNRPSVVVPVAPPLAPADAVETRTPELAASQAHDV